MLSELERKRERYKKGKLFENMLNFAQRLRPYNSE